MDESRWPDRVHEFVARIVCPRCSAPRERVMVTVRYSQSPPMWTFRIVCPGCSTDHETQWLDMFRMLPPKAPEPEPIPLPQWVKELA